MYYKLSKLYIAAQLLNIQKHNPALSLQQWWVAIDKASKIS